MTLAVKSGLQRGETRAALLIDYDRLFVDDCVVAWERRGGDRDRFAAVCPVVAAPSPNRRLAAVCDDAQPTPIPLDLTPVEPTGGLSKNVDWLGSIQSGTTVWSLAALLTLAGFFVGMDEVWGQAEESPVT